MGDIEISVNGERMALACPLSVAALVERRGLTGKRVAIELNGAVVPKSRHAEQLVADGDQLEIVVAVGGG